MEPWHWAVILLLAGLSLSVLEIFVPSGGVFGVLCLFSIIGAIVMAFREGPLTGFAIICGAAAGVPVVVALALKWWPHTPIGRRMLLMTPSQDEVLPESSRLRALKGMVGHVGVTKSKMLPSGAVVIDHQTIDAVSEGPPIELGQKVRVIEVRGNRVVVRAIAAETPSEDEENPLARPIDSIAPDPFGDPPA